MAVKGDVTLPTQRICSRCKFVSSQEVCKACVLLEGLNKGLPRLGIGKSSKAKKMLEEYNAKQEQDSGNLTKAIQDLDDGIEDKKNTLPQGKTCRSGSCKSKNYKQNINESIVNNVKQCNSDKCCSGTCRSNKIKPEQSNAKINMLLEQYGLNDSTQNSDSPDSGGGENTVVNGNHKDDSDDEDNLLYSNQDEENSCSGTCGKMGSLQIGF